MESGGSKALAPTAPALDLEAHVQAVEKAARDWGVSVDQLEGKFVSALLAAISAVGRSNIATIADLGRLLEGTREAGEVELRRLKALLDGGQQVLELAREAAKTAARAQKQTRDEYDQAIVRVAKTMADKLLDSSQRWLVLKQTDYNRRSAWRHAAVVSAAVLALVALGYGYRGWQDGPAAEALERCAAAPIMLKIGDQQQLVPACRLDHLAKRDVKDLPEALREWFAEWLP
jgi:hypothetical protein